MTNIGIFQKTFSLVHWLKFEIFGSFDESLPFGIGRQAHQSFQTGQENKQRSKRVSEFEPSAMVNFLLRNRSLHPACLACNSIATDGEVVHCAVATFEISMDFARRCTCRHIH
jgi:hypothetical protein